jgi:hypothetical protein
VNVVNATQDSSRNLGPEGVPHPILGLVASLSLHSVTKDTTSQLKMSGQNKEKVEVLQLYE